MINSNIIFFEKNEIIREGLKFSLNVADRDNIHFTNTFQKTLSLLKNKENRISAIIIGTDSLGMFDFGLIEQFAKANTDVKFIYLVWWKNSNIISRLINLKPDAILYKPSNAEELKRALRIIKNGGRFINIPELIENDFADIKNVTNRLLTLSARELEVLELIGKGLTSKQIAEEINISHYTVENHRKNMLKKTKAKNIVELVNYLPQ